ncbi:MAG: TrkA C-terminal domain-containing protein [Bacteroidales bacterium]|nr:TrkA C-terminal domain-containing protein [Bacteroidales bacterium]
MSLVPIITVICIVTISLLITKIAAAMLANTGLSMHSAKFQSRSAFTGVGFTTSESEQITTHPTRRKIVASLMLLGNAGIVTVMASLLLTFVHKDEQGMPWYYGISILVVATIILTIVASSNKVDAALTRVVNRFLGRYKFFSTYNYGSLYKLADDYHISNLFVREGGWLIGKTPSDEQIQKDGIIVLGIEKPDGSYVGIVTPDTVFQETDLLIVYGREHALKLLDPLKRKDPNAPTKP